MKTRNLLLFLSIVVAIVFISCKSNQTEEKSVKNEVAAVNTLTESEKQSGWILMFNGENFDGWRSYQKDSFPAQGWVIEDNALKCLGSGAGEAGGQGGDIIFDQKFKDFHLSLEWKISEGGNSGIFYLAQELEGEPIWKSAPEMQILDNDKHLDANLGKDGNRQAGSLYDLIPAKPQNAKPAGEWNKAEVLIYQGTVVHKQNGEVVLEYHIGTSDFDQMIANSKFKEFTEFGKYIPGYIGLQDHGNDVWFRNVKIRQL